MSKCIYKEIADNLDRDKLIDFYQTHLPKDVALEFGFDQIYFYRIFDYLNIPRRSAAENTKIQFEYYDMTKRNKQVSESNLGRVFSDEVRLKISNSNKGIKKHPNITSWTKGHIPWNKGLKGVQIVTQEIIDKRNATKKKLHTFNSSSTEENLYKELCDKYGSDDVCRQYKDKERYPFFCDFYIKSKDLFIELNAHWTHGTHAFDSNNQCDIAKLNEWIEKSKTSKFYATAIDVWTVRDVKKLKTAKENNLNYQVIY